MPLMIKYIKKCIENLKIDYSFDLEDRSESVQAVIRLLMSINTDTSNMYNNEIQELIKNFKEKSIQPSELSSFGGAKKTRKYRKLNRKTKRRTH